MNDSKIDIEKVGTSALVGIAGGATIAGMLPFGLPGLIVGGIVGAYFTGKSEYNREKSDRYKNSENRTKMPSKEEQLHRY